MRIHRGIRNLLALALAFCAQSAFAFLDPPYITPENPAAGDTISVNIYGGECDLVHDGVVWPPPVTQNGNVLTILLTGVHESDPEWCYFSVATRTYPLGIYPAGSYTVRVDWQYFNFAGVLVRETLGIIPLTVSGAPPRRPIEMPSLSAMGLALLFLALIAAPLLARSRKV